MGKGTTASGQPGLAVAFSIFSDTWLQHGPVFSMDVGKLSRTSTATNNLDLAVYNFPMMFGMNLTPEFYLVPT